MFLAQAKRTVLNASRAAFALLKVFERSYEPSKYYMRGPGPKAHEAKMRDGRAGRGQSEASAHG